MKDKYIIGIIGAGNMGEALIRGLLRSSLVRSYEIIASDKLTKRTRFLEKTYGIHTTRSNFAVINATDIIILAMKPQDIDEIASQIKKDLTKDHLIISIAAGVDFLRLRSLLGPNPKLIRVMPNLPALIDEGVSAIYCGPKMPERYRRFAHQIFQAVGSTVDIKEEKLMDVVTGLSGTGPAYFFAMMEALRDAGKKLGLSEKMANDLTIKTAFGAAQMAIQSQDTPEELRQKVTSKKGTTWAAMNYLKQRNFWNIMGEAVARATKRAGQLRKM